MSRMFLRTEMRLAVALLLGAITTSTAYAQLAKSDSFSVRYGWKAQLTNQQLEEGHLVRVGFNTGMIFNDAGEGIMHNASCTCTLAPLEVVGDKFTGTGFCDIADGDGDKIFVKWQCAGPAPGPGPQQGRCAGTIKITAGTGKYQGITGGMEFHGGGTGGGYGYSVWKGNYQLP